MIVITRSVTEGSAGSPTKPRSDDAYYAPLAGLKRKPETELYLGLVQSDDMTGNAARVAAARR
jgi:hypothetical protein